MPFQIIRNDITNMHTDAIVNTANPRPEVGTGTDAAVYTAAGTGNLLECRLKIGVLEKGDVAVTLEMLRYREQYILWLITDVIAVAMYIQHFDPVYLTKKTIYLIVAVIGLINWIKLNRQRNVENE